MKLAVPDMISNSYFPAIAAAELGFFKQEGLDRAEEVRRNGSQARLFIRNGVLHIPVGPCESILCILCEEFGGL